MKELHGVIISEAANFDARKAEINTRIEECYREREEFNSKVQSQIGRIVYLIVEKHFIERLAECSRLLCIL
jgi:uncharacterized coiled-coil DUF342 family protein